LNISFYRIFCTLTKLRENAFLSNLTVKKQKRFLVKFTKRNLGFYKLLQDYSPKSKGYKTVTKVFCASSTKTHLCFRLTFTEENAIISQEQKNRRKYAQVQMIDSPPPISWRKHETANIKQ